MTTMHAFHCSDSVLGLLAAVNLFAAAAFAAPGDLDVSFGSGGKVVTAIGSGEDQSFSVAVQNDGKIVVAGYASLGPLNFALARYTASGALDTSFGTGGRVTTSFGSTYSQGRSVAVQSDGKIVVAGEWWNGSNEDFALARYNTDGTLDTGFGTGGKVTTPIGMGQDQGRSVAVQSDGKIVVVGNSANGSDVDFAIVRYTTSGSLDATFGSGGNVVTPIGSSTDIAFSVAVQGDGKIVTTGFSINGSNTEIGLLRYTGNGELDSGFGTGGKVTTSVGSSIRGDSVTVQSDGKIVVAGSFYTGSNNDFALLRYNANGTLDSSFGTNGVVTTPLGTGNDTGASTVLQADGKIIVAGSSYNGVNYDFALVRYTASGALDTGFGTGGKVTTPIGSGTDFGQSVALQGGGKILVAGYSSNGSNSDFALARYEAGDSAAPEIDVQQPAGTSVLSGGSRSFGTLTTGSTADLAFTISNAGPVELLLDGVPKVTVTGTDAGLFTVTTPPVSPVVAGSTTAFTVQFAPTDGGAKSAVIHIANNDPDENPYDINLTGLSLSFTTDTDGDGLNDAAEFQMAALGFDWQVSQPSLVNALYSNASGAGLYTQAQYDANRSAGRNDILNSPNAYNLYSLSQVQALNVDVPLIAKQAGTGQFKLTLALKKSTNLVTFTPFSFTAPQTTVNAQGEVEFVFTVPDNAAFFRVSAH